MLPGAHTSPPPVDARIPAESAPTFLPQVLPEGEAVSRINLYGGPAKADLEALYGFLQRAVGPAQLSRGYYFRFVRVDALFGSHAEELRARMGRGVPHDRFRPLLARCLSFLREQGIVEVLPVLQSKDQTQDLICADYLLFQDSAGAGLDTAVFRERAIADSAEAAGRFLIRQDAEAAARLDKLLADLDPDFLLQFPYYRMLQAYRSDWHPPVDESHAFFGDLPRFKEQLFLQSVYARLLSDGKLTFDSRLEGVRKLATRFPLAWPTSDAQLARLTVVHGRLRALFAGRILGLEGGPASPPELDYHRIPGDSFQAACSGLLSSSERTPGVTQAHNLGVHVLGFAKEQLLAREDRLRPDQKFARNLIVAMLMHTETVNQHAQKQSHRKEEDRLQETLQTIARAMPPIVDVGALVRAKETQDERRRELLDAVLKHEQIRSADHLRVATFGSERIQVAFHMLRINDVFAFAAGAAAEGDFSWHTMLERRFGTQEHPEKLKPQLREEVYESFLRTREALYATQLPWYRRLLRALGIGRQTDPAQVARAVTSRVAHENEELQATVAKEQKAEVRRLRDERMRESTANRTASRSAGVSAATSQPVERRAQRPPQQFQQAPGPEAVAQAGGSAAGDSAAAATPELADEELGAFLGVAVESTPAQPRLSRHEVARLSEEASSPDVVHEIDDRAWEQGLGREARAQTREVVPESQPKKRRASSDGSWEQEVISVGERVGLDLSERGRLERQAAREARRMEKDQKKQERRRKAAERGRERAGRHARSHAEAGRSGGGAGRGSDRRHSVVVSVPVSHSASGKPDEILFKRHFFKDAEFRKGMARFYEAEGKKAATSEERKYYQFLRRAMEEDYAKFL